MRRIRLVAIPLFLLSLVFVSTSCTNVQKLYDKGNYQAVVDKVE